MLVIIFMHDFKLYWWFMMDGNYCQQTPPKLNLCPPWALTNFCNGLGVLGFLKTLKQLLKSTHAFKQEFSSRLEQTILTSKLTHITFNHGACILHLSLGQLKDRTIKSSTMYQVLCSTIIPEFLHVFKLKLKHSIIWHSQVSQNMWYLWILAKAIVMLYLSSYN
jgi:hypothetical protein